MSDNDPDERFSMPPIEGMGEGADTRDPADDPDPEDTRPKGLTLPPPGLFARLDEPSLADSEDEPADVTAALPPIDRFDDEVEVEEPPSYVGDDLDDEPAPVGLSGIADAIDIVEQLAVRAEAAEEPATPPSGDDLVFADAAFGSLPTDESDDVDELDAEPEAEPEPEPEPEPLPTYAALADIDEPAPSEETELPPPPITLPMYGDGERQEDEEEILPHFLLEEAAPLDIVAAQDQLREMASKNRAKVADQERERPGLARTLAEIPVLLLVAAVIAFLVKTFLAQAYYIPSGSMIPQLQIDDRVVVSKLAFKFHDPRRGDIVVFDDPRSGADASSDEESNILRKIGEGVGVVQPSTDEFIKRVIGLPGETVSGHDGYVYINGHKLIEPYLPEGVKTDDFAQQTVAQGKLWVMGDNRTGSADSRVFGQIKIDSIVGRAVVKVWPLSHISFL